MGRLAIAQQIVTTALGGVVTGSATKKADSVPLGNLTCQKTCTGASCAVTCPIDERFDCPAGGSATDKGQIAGTLDGELSGEAALAAAQAFSACKPNAGLTIDGAPATTATGNARFAKGQLDGRADRPHRGRGELRLDDRGLRPVRRGHPRHLQPRAEGLGQRHRLRPVGRRGVLTAS